MKTKKEEFWELCEGMICDHHKSIPTDYDIFYKIQYGNRVQLFFIFADEIHISSSNVLKKLDMTEMGVELCAEQICEQFKKQLEDFIFYRFT